MNRRRMLSECAGGFALAALAPRFASAFQTPSPQPLEDSRYGLVVTTESNPWRQGAILKPAFSFEMLNLNIEPEKTLPTGAAIDGFGACFNELGWTSLQALGEADRESVLREFFDPAAGARFTYCRMPIGANDFATEAYSYDETDGDFDLKHFSIDHDRRTLIPFIQAALRYQPKLRLWASPWSPPSWMKRNHFYAESKAYPGQKDNGIRPDQVGHEGEDMFIQDPRYFAAYARYFGRFIDAYQAEGIRVGMVMPQNEFNSAQNFPSCTWTPEALARFLHDLGPEMQKRGVDVFFGTLERGNPRMLETVMADKEAARFVKGVGAQWAGKNALPAIHVKYPGLVIYQSEQECGFGENSWAYAGYCWHLMKHYFRSGATAYMYWNISTAKGGMSTWGWPQNSLVSVDRAAKTFHYNHDYYLLKHVSHFVEVGARSLAVSGTCDDALAFRNPDGGCVVVVRNELSHPQLVQVQVGERAVAINLPADSIGTLTVKAG
ncbi:MAG TPA: glycoside hydrolase family 30 protein [Bryobacteraceae bacterium]|nr:glycoside hydrolase family 30 protein [Bryobacteraceae bacterium]